MFVKFIVLRVTSNANDELFRCLHFQSRGMMTRLFHGGPGVEKGLIGLLLSSLCVVQFLARLHDGGVLLDLSVIGRRLPETTSSTEEAPSRSGTTWGGGVAGCTCFGMPGVSATVVVVVTGGGGLRGENSVLSRVPVGRFFDRRIERRR
jgi:hypothetical protein